MTEQSENRVRGWLLPSGVIVAIIAAAVSYGVTTARVDANADDIRQNADDIRDLSATVSGTSADIRWIRDTLKEIKNDIKAR